MASSGMLGYLLALILPLVHAEGGTFFITASKYVHPGASYELTVSLLNPGATAEVTALLGTRVESYYERNPDEGMDVSPKVVVSKTQTISGSGSITLQVPEIELDRRYLELNVTGTGGVTFMNSSRLEILTKKISIFVQTDKARYKPGDEAKFRIFATGADLRVHTGNIDVEIYDGDSNKIKQFLQQAVPTGLFSTVLPISSQPVLGLWKIKVTVNGEELTKTFKVEEYVLPKFKVEVGLPSFAVKHMDSLPITVKANYTFGKPVIGQAVVLVRMEPGYYCYDPNHPQEDMYGYMERKPCKSKQFKVELKEGQFSTSVSRKELQDMLMETCYTRGNCHQQNFEYSTYEVTANVTESATGETQTAREIITIQLNGLVAKFLDSTPESYKPGLDYKAWIKIERPDGQPPAPGDYKGNLKVKILRYCPYKPEKEKDPNCNDVVTTEHEVNMEDHPDGLIQYTLPEPIEDKFESFTMEALIVDKYDENISAMSNTIKKFDTQTEKNIQIQMDTLPLLKAGTTVTLKIRSSESISKIYYQLLAKGKIVRQDVLESAAPSMQHDLVLDLDANFAQTLSPSAKLVVFYFADAAEGRKEAIADSVSLTVDATFAYETEVSFSKSEVQPADQLTLNVESAKDSTVALLAVDQSVLLLESGNDITVDKVEEEMRGYDPKSSYYPWLSYYRGGRRKKRMAYIGGCFPIYVGGSNIKDMMREVGMIFMCDCIQQGNSFSGHGPYMTYDRPGVYISYDSPGVYEDDTEILSAMLPAPSGRGNSAVKNPIRTRKLFPEAWIWESISVGDGKLEMPINAPDTITSWILSAFAINPQLGLSVAQTAKTTVFQPFFVRTSQPYSVVRTERFALKVTVFNYLSSDQDVTVVLDQSDKFKVIDQNGTEANKRVELKMKVMSQGTNTKVIWVVPEALGQIPFKISATCSQAGDIVIRNILVKAEGAPKTYTESEFMEVNSAGPSTLMFLPDIPNNAVPGSERITINVVGDLMGSAMDNLEDLVRMPYGCGEQNMINFAPNIYILSYLTVTGQDNEAIRTKSLKYMDQGYQRELTYKRKDNSFSAFGDSDKEGSTWLTAFVMKCFSQARDFIKVDEDVLKASTKFLIAAQDRSGEFRKIGMVHHSDLKGGAGQGVSLTAYTAIAMLELQEVIPSDELQESLKKAVTYLEGKIESSKNDAYTLSIITYALSLAKSSQASYALNQLNVLATERKGQRFWTDPQAQSYADFAPWERYHATPPLDVETASYGLMATLSQGGDGIPIVRWLTSRMNPQGGFYSTQDTVLGLEALGKFTAKLRADVTAQSVNVEVLAMNNAHSFDPVSTANSAIVQVYEAPANSGEVTVTGTGQGSVVVQMTVSYNVMEEKNSKDFDLDIRTHYSENTVTVAVCMSYKGTEESGMSILQVDSLSGFYPDGSKELVEKYKKNGIKTAEVDGSKMVTYWDEVGKERKCIEVNQKRADSVLNLQEQQVKIYRYYAPEVQQASFYQVPAQLQGVDVCLACPDCEYCEPSSSASNLRTVISAMIMSILSAFLLTL